MDRFSRMLLMNTTAAITDPELDPVAYADAYRFAIMELEFMHPDVMVDNVLRRGDFAPGGPGDPDRHLRGLVRTPGPADGSSMKAGEATT